MKVVKINKLVLFEKEIIENILVLNCITEDMVAHKIKNGEVLTVYMPTTKVTAHINPKYIVIYTLDKELADLNDYGLIEDSTD